MNLFSKGSVYHAVEWLVVFLFAGFVLFLFKDPVNAFLLNLVNDPETVQKLREGLFAVIGFITAQGLKRAREQGVLPDYVNGEHE